MVWETVNPRPCRKQCKRGPQEVTVDTQPSKSSEDIEMSAEDSAGDHPYTLASPEVNIELALRWQASPNSYKRELSPPCSHYFSAQHSVE